MYGAEKNKYKYIKLYVNNINNMGFYRELMCLRVKFLYCVVSRIRKKFYCVVLSLCRNVCFLATILLGVKVV